MIKKGAVTILITMITGAIAWAGVNIIGNKTAIAVLKNDKTYIIKKLDKMDSKLDRILESR